MKNIICKYTGECEVCGVRIDVGEPALWLGKGRLECEVCTAIETADSDEPLGMTLSRHDPYGVYTPAGVKIGSTCNCEDYPCCGH